jgi:hypothetical protein
MIRSDDRIIDRASLNAVIGRFPTLILLSREP